MKHTLTDNAVARIKAAKTLHDLVRKPYKGKITDPNLTITDRVAMLLMGSDGLTTRNVERQLGLTTNQVSHALFCLDVNPHISVKRKQGKFRNTRLYYI